MKTLLTFFLTLMIHQLHAQGLIAGEYEDNCGSKFILKPDSTFNFNWQYHLYSSWTNGTWKSRNDTIYFQPVPVYDTLKFKTDSRPLLDSLIVSLDEKPDVISHEEYLNRPLPGRGQSINLPPNKLYYRKGRLYSIKEDGKLKKRKAKHPSLKNYCSPWFERKE